MRRKAGSEAFAADYREAVADAAARKLARAAYARARSRAVHAASQILRERHLREYTELLTEALRSEGLT